MYGYFLGVQRMVRGERWKYIRYPEVKVEQLFDLASDPYELKDLSSDSRHGVVLADLRSRLSAWQRKVKDPILNP